MFRPHSISWPNILKTEFHLFRKTIPGVREYTPLGQHVRNLRAYESGEIEILKMNQEKLKTLLKQSDETVERQADCPDDYQLASYMEGGLSERDHGDFEAHLADCPFCIERIGVLGRAGESKAANPESDQSRIHTGNSSYWLKAPRWAAAAMVVVAVGFITNRQLPSRAPTVSNELPGPRIVTERFAEPASPIPEILSPLENSSVDPQDLVFRWKGVPDSLFYDIRIVSDDGEMITRKRVWDTQWSLPTDLQLQAGAEYFVRVDAFVSEGKALSSEHTAFRIDDEQ